MGADDLELFDGAVGAGDMGSDEEEDAATDEPEPDAYTGDDAGYASPEASASDAPSESGSDEAGVSNDASAGASDAGGGRDAASSDAGSSSDAGTDAGSRNDASVDAGRDAGGGTTGGASDSGAGGSRDSGTPSRDSGTPSGGMCSADKCTNECSIAAPFRCCTSDNKCGCSWFSVAYCND